MKASGVAGALRHQLEQQLTPPATENAVHLVTRGPSPTSSVRGRGIEPVRQRVIEVQLRGELEATPLRRRRPDLEVDVDRPALVPSGIDRRELRAPLFIRHLISTQEFLSDCIEARVLNV